MNWSDLAEFADMGGYAMYVWGAYAMAVAAALWEGVVLVQRRRIALDEWRQQAREMAAEQGVSHAG